MSHHWPDKVQIVEVGPRDGLQNESVIVPTAVKAELIQHLLTAGLSQIEVTSFVHPRLVPQLADANELLALLPRSASNQFSALVPNLKGWERARACELQRIAIFTAASETFARKNINMSVAESLDAYRPLVHEARTQGCSVRAYLSTCFVCPYEGEMAVSRVVELSQALLDLGADEVAISDTIGAAAPTDIERTIGALLEHVPAERIALHLHDTYGTALANVVAGLQLGIRTFDSSCGGLGGCPFAPGASGNLATEDLVYLLQRMNIACGVDMSALQRAAAFIASRLGRELSSRHWKRWQCKPSTTT
ncbi:MAG: Hydroxymethylglutaryl-CoA lyase YngG [Phycisphaerae bacterium]|nr:Hydroxymethylglutaryl-CoA lyase YngG [Phycisphaerae bacterium]